MSSKQIDEYREDPRYYGWRIRSQMRTFIRRALPVFPPPHRDSFITDGRPRWVVCFYGVDRSLRYTFWGIQKHILNILSCHGISVTVVAHFNRIPRIAGTYSKEGRVFFSRDHIHLLRPDMLWVEPQTESAITPELDGIAGSEWKHPHPLFANAKVNLLHQLHSLSRVAELLRLGSLSDADVYALLRADLQYLDDVHPGVITRDITEKGIDLITPAWQRWGGLNDRFAFVSQRAVTAVLTRRQLVREFADQFGYIHAEELLRFTAERHGLILGDTSLRAERVRGNGRVEFEPFDARDVSE